MLIFAENKREGIKHFISAKPDVPGLAVFQAGLETRFVGFAHNAIETISGNQQIVVAKFGKVVYLATELYVDTEFVAATLQDIQQAFARDAGNYMSSATYLLISIIHIDSIPDHEMLSDLFVRFIVCSLEGGQCAIRKNDTPAIGDVCRIALDDGDVVRRIGLFNQQAAIEPCRSTTEDNYLHLALLASP